LLGQHVRDLEAWNAHVEKKYDDAVDDQPLDSMRPGSHDQSSVFLRFETFTVARCESSRAGGNTILSGSHAE
jgi:hypothetical protein